MAWSNRCGKRSLLENQNVTGWTSESTSLTACMYNTAVSNFLRLNRTLTAVSKQAKSLNALAHRYGPFTHALEGEELRNFKFYIELTVTATSLVLNFHINRRQSRPWCKIKVRKITVYDQNHGIHGDRDSWIRDFLPALSMHDVEGEITQLLELWSFLQCSVGLSEDYRLVVLWQTWIAHACVCTCSYVSSDTLTRSSREISASALRLIPIGPKCTKLQQFIFIISEYHSAPNECIS